MRFQCLVSPVIPRRLLHIARHSVARSLEQRPRGSGVEAWIVAGRQVELATRSTGVVPIIIDKRSRHGRQKEAEGRSNTLH